MKKFFSLIIIFLIASKIYSANINVDELNVIFDGSFVTDTTYDAENDKNRDITKFNMNTYFKFVTSFDGGYKFAARVAFETSVKNLEQNYSLNSLGLGNVYLFFKSADVRIRNLAYDHLDLVFWTGTYKYLGDGNKYRGYLYYPESNDLDFQGFYRLRGTGLSTEFKFWEDVFRFNFHLYQNTNFINIEPMAIDYFAIDSEAGLYFKNVNIEVFGGYTKELVYPYTDASSDLIYGRGKAGFTFWVGNEYIDFFSTFGLSNIDNTIANISINSFYILGELHFKLFITDNVLSFLMRPNLYNEISKAKRNDLYDFDVSYKLNIASGDFPLSGGLLFNLKYSLSDTTNWSLIAAPFLSISTSGVIWSLYVHYDFGAIYRNKYLDGLKIVLSVTSKF